MLGEVGDADRVSVRAIARRAGVSPTALYLHFPDRDALVDAAVDAGFAAFNAELIAAASGPGPPRDRLEAMGVAYLVFAERRPALYAVLFSAQPSGARTARRPAPAHASRACGRCCRRSTRRSAATTPASSRC